MDEMQSSPVLDQDGDAKGMSTAAKIGIGVGILACLLVFAVALYFLVKYPGTTETVRDLFIIVLALESLVIGTLLVVLIFQLIVLVRMLRDDLKPIFESAQEALNTAKGTTTFVSERATRPAIAASGYIAGIGRSISVMIGMLPRRRAKSATPTDDAATVEIEEAGKENKI